MKVAYSAQEWCGQLAHVVWFDEARVRSALHSYFEGEGDRNETFERPTASSSEDTLLMWARGMSGPRVEPGETVEVPLLRSLQEARLRHVPLGWRTATLSRAAETESVESVLGPVEARHATVTIQQGPTWQFLVEDALPHRILRFSSSDGTRLELVALERIAYWARGGRADESLRRDLGLEDG